MFATRLLCSDPSESETDKSICQKSRELLLYLSGRQFPSMLQYYLKKRFLPSLFSISSLKQSATESRQQCICSFLKAANEGRAHCKPATQLALTVSTPHSLRGREFLLFSQHNKEYRCQAQVPICWEFYAFLCHLLFASFV